jgi:Skp family chaperone for outer membrane proteins
MPGFYFIFRLPIHSFMKKFLQFSIGTFLILTGISFVIASVQPAYGDDQRMHQSETDPDHLRVFYINIDSINAKYKAYTSLADSATRTLNGKMQEYQDLSAQLHDRYTLLQQRVAIGAISAEAAMHEENAISEGLEKLTLREEELARIESAALARNDSISAHIAFYMAGYAEKQKADYVMMYGTGMPIIYANPKFDVTDEVLNTLNAEYDLGHSGSGPDNSGKKK